MDQPNVGSLTEPDPMIAGVGETYPGEVVWGTETTEYRVGFSV